MKVVFADTFYGAALTTIDDPANARALHLSRSLAPDRTLTTDEALAEYLTFFAGARPSVRDRAGRNVADLINNLEVRVVPQTGNPSLLVCKFTAPVLTRVTAWSIVFRCRRCARND